MKSYASFLVRFWLIRDAPPREHMVFDIEHIQTGEHTRVKEFCEAQEWFRRACRVERRESGAPSADDE